jgi:hypothetical protein
MAQVAASVVMVMSTVPWPRGLVPVISVAESDIIVASAPPKLTSVAPARPVPQIVTTVSPVVLPLSVRTPVTVRVGRR